MTGWHTIKKAPQDNKRWRVDIEAGNVALEEREEREGFWSSAVWKVAACALGVVCVRPKHVC